MQQSLLQSIVSFAETCEAVSALILIGSQARAERKADAFSDIDLIMIVNDTERFIHADQWLTDIGRHHISFTEPTISGQTERRLLFDGALDVDLVIIDEAAALFAMESGEAAGILCRGYRVLVNKHHIEVPPLLPTAAFAPATEAEFRNTVHDFWYHTVWATKKLLRDEVWVAKFCVDGYMKSKLLWMIEQYEHIVRRSGCDTWYAGRFIDRWAAEDILRDLRHTFAHYNRTDIAAALRETMKLYRRLAQAVAEGGGFPYPAHADDYATQWVLPQLASFTESQEHQ